MIAVLMLVQLDSDLQLFQQAFTGRTEWPLFANPMIWAMAAFTVGVLCAGIVIIGVIRRDRAAFGPTNRRLCTALGIRSRERRILRRMARSGGFTNAASLLISEGGFEYAARHYQRRYGQTSALEQIRLHVFDRR